MKQNKRLTLAQKQLLNAIKAGRSKVTDAPTDVAALSARNLIEHNGTKYVVVKPNPAVET